MDDLRVSDAERVLRDPERLAAVRKTGLIDSPSEEVFDRLTRLAAKLIGAPVTFLSLVEEDRDFYKSCFGFGEPLASSRELKGQTFCHYAIPLREPLVIPDTLADPVYREVPTVKSLGIRAYLGVPLVTAENQAIGSFCAVDFEPRQWSTSDIDIVRELAGSALREIELRQEVTERRLAEEALRRQARITTLGAEVGNAVVEGGGLQETLQRCADAMVRHLEAAFARIWVLNEAEQVLELQASAGLYTHLDGEHARVPVGEFKIGLIATERKPHLTNDVQHDPLVSDKEWARHEGMVAFAGYPLVVEDHLVGVMATFARQPLSEADLEALSSIADRIALAIDLKQIEQERELLLQSERAARQEAERRAVEEAALRRAAQAVTASYTVEEASRRIAESAVEATRADGAFVEQVDLALNRATVTAVAGERTPISGDWVPFRGSFAELVLQQHRAELIPQICSAGRPLPSGLSERCGDCTALVVPLHDGGEPVGALILLRDPRHEPFRRDEIERAQTFGDLAALAFRKIHLLEESERRRRELEEVTESRARLMRGFSHDLKNPLGAADGHAQLLEDQILGTLQPRQHESVRRIRSLLSSALELINELVELARTEAGQIELEIRPTDLRSLVTETVEEFRAQAESGGLTLTTVAPEVFPLTLSDPSRVRQVLSNLISNAVKYSRRGDRVEVGVEVACREGHPDRWVAVSVADTGIGIPQDKLHLLFREFSRVESDSRPGAGLGLAISQRLAQALRGEITVQSEHDQGSTFTLWLPLDEPGSEVDGDQ